MGRGLKLIPVWMLGCHRAPRHRRHEKIAVTQVIKQRLDNAFGAEASTTEPRNGTVNDQSPVAWDAKMLQDRLESCGFPARHSSADRRWRFCLDFLDHV